ncbi:Alpha/beta hydrolase [Geodermatophilus obscurus]|uniref:Alpha/beta hydrolase n=1 Tax=Geodermatophilus obscurus TaxID=1861 RepID=A0A1M7V1C1_9ACTN|nr:alpha/beta hydrolase [Geodermatophilus obscurus]SHN88986.1 Alpha/beta hydrolase [Geodermatophilus obscurus]
MSAPTLAEVAGWDVPLLRGAVWTLDSVAAGLPAWRARVEAVGRSLEDASCWYGPAAQSAGAALVDVSTVATGVTAALDESLEHAQRLLAEAETAQELAERALAAAASIPVVLDGAGRLVGPLPVDPTGEADAVRTAAVVRVEALAADALAAAGRAGLGAGEAVAALMGLGIGGTLAPATFEDLSWLVAVEDASTPAPPPSGNDPTAVAAWWAGLSTAARVSAIHGRPRRIGDLEGLPAWARDRANRLVLDRTLVTPRRTGGPPVPGQAMAVSVAAEIARREASGEEVQLLQFDPGAGLTALGLGDLDTAGSVAFVVPGMLNSPERTLDDVVAAADTVADAGRAADPGLAVAAVAWFGYRPPLGIGALGTSISREGGRALDNALDGLSAARAADPVRVVVSAHSYGTRVVGAAAAAPGPMAAGAVILNGSPGMDGNARSLEVAEVYEASSPVDPITWWDAHGEYATWDDDFGAVELPTGQAMHGEYYDADHPTRAVIGEVVAGVREPA